MESVIFLCGAVGKEGRWSPHHLPSRLYVYIIWYVSASYLTKTFLTVPSKVLR